MPSKLEPRQNSAPPSAEERMSSSQPELKQNPGFFRDLAQFLLQSKRWWMIPIVLVLLLVGGLLVLGGTSLAPFVYSLF